MNFGCSALWIAPLIFGSANSDCADASSRPASATTRAHRMVTECLNQALILSHIVVLLESETSVIHAHMAAARARARAAVPPVGNALQRIARRIFQPYRNARFARPPALERIEPPRGLIEPALQVLFACRHAGCSCARACRQCQNAYAAMATAIAAATMTTIMPAPAPD